MPTGTSPPDALRASERRWMVVIVVLLGGLGWVGWWWTHGPQRSDFQAARPALDRLVAELGKRPELVAMNLRTGRLFEKKGGAITDAAIPADDGIARELRTIGAVSLDRGGLVPGAILVTLSARGLVAHGAYRGFACTTDAGAPPPLAPAGAHGLKRWEHLDGCWATFEVR